MSLGTKSLGGAKCDCVNAPTAGGSVCGGG